MNGVIITIEKEELVFIIKDAVKAVIRSLRF